MSPKTSIIGSRLFRLTVTAIVFLAGVLIFFRGFFLSNFSLVVGDVGDGQLIQSIHEHWYRFLLGETDWLNLRMFYPVEDTLGYSDTFLFSGMIHSLYRALGMDPFIAFQWTQMTLAAIGFSCLTYWLHHHRKIPYPLALLGGFLLIVGSTFYINIRNSHIQMLSLWLVPLLVILMESTWENLRLERLKEGTISFALLGFFSGLLAYSTFYVAFFLILFLLSSLLVFIALGNWRTLKDTFWPSRTRLLMLAPGVVLLALFAGLLLWTYLPVRLEMGGYPVEVAIATLPQPWHLFNHSSYNLLWGQINKLIWPYSDATQWGFELLLPPLTLLMSIMAIFLLFRKGKAKSREERFLFVLGIAFIAGLLLITRIGDHSLWIIPFRILPGAEAIRVAVRYAMMLYLPAILLVIWLLQVGWKKGGLNRLAVPLVAALLCLEQIQLTPAANLDRHEKLSLVEQAPPPPAEAEAFYMFAEPWQGWNMDIPHNTAQFLAQQWNVPTINGRSGFNAPDWNLIDSRPNAAFPRLLEWAEKQGLDSMVYLFHLESLQWVRRIDFSLQTSSGLSGIDLLDFPPETFARISENSWSGAEFWGYWSKSEEAHFSFKSHSFQSGKATLSANLKGFINEKRPEGIVDVYINNERIQTIVFTEDSPSVSLESNIEIPAGDWQLRFQIVRPQSPLALGTGSDERQLGLGLESLTITPVQ